VRARVAKVGRQFTNIEKKLLKPKAATCFKGTFRSKEFIQNSFVVLDGVEFVTAFTKARHWFQY
jgi:hypothetical protein